MAIPAILSIMTGRRFLEDDRPTSSSRSSDTDRPLDGDGDGDRDGAAVVAGAVIFCIAVGTALGAQISGRFSDRAGPRAPSLVGLGLQILVALALAGLDTSLAVLVPVAFVSGLAGSLWNVPNNGAMMASVPFRNFAVVGAFTNVTRTVGGVVGQALAAAIVVAVMAGQGFDIPLNEIADSSGAGGAFLDGWRTAYLVTATLTGGTFLLALRLPAEPVITPDRAPT